MRKTYKVIILILISVSLIYFIGSGFMVRSDVGVGDYVVSPNGDEMTINVGVISSAGYIRHVRNVSKDPGKLELKCYAAFGGMINGSIGAENRFVIPLSSECKEIYLYSFGEYRLVLQKEALTGEWQLTK